MKNRAGILVLIIAGVIIGLLIAEILVRIFLPQNRLTTWIEMHPDGFMMNQPGVTAIHNFNERSVQYRLNEMGLRGGVLPPDDELKVLFLGDSFTFGLLLDEDDTFLAKLQQHVNRAIPDKRINLLNGGVGGAGLADWPLWLGEFGQKISPDVVIYVLNTADIDRSISKNLFIANQADSSLIQSRRWKPNKLMMKIGRQGWYRSFQRHSDLMNLLVSIAWDNLYFKDVTNGFNYQTSQTALPSEQQRQIESGYSNLLGVLLLEKMKNWCEENECDFMVTTTGFFGFGKDQYYTQPFWEKLMEENPQKFPFFDISECMMEHTEGNSTGIVIEGDGHPNEEGSALIAECTWSWLQEYLMPEYP